MTQATLDTGRAGVAPRREARSIDRALATGWWASYRFPLALSVLAVALWLPRLSGPIDLRYDAGVYYLLGTSLAEGHGYRLLNEPGAIEAIQYPPLLPAFVAVYQWVAGTSDPLVVGQMLRLSYAVLFMLLGVGVYVFGRRFLSPGLAFVTGLITLLHAEQLWLADLLHAELPYTLVTVAFLALWGLGPPMIRTGVGGALAGAAFLLRTAGIALLAAWVLEGLRGRRYRQTALRAGLALLPFLGWQLYVSQVRSGPDYENPSYPYQRAAYQYYNVSYLENLLYIDSFEPELGRVSPAGLVGRVATNLLAMPPALGEAVSSRAEWPRSQLQRVNTSLPVPIPLWLVYVPLLLLAAGVIGGLAILARRGEWLMPLYVAGSVGLIALTPWPGQFSRYVAPLTPVLAVALLVGVSAARDHLQARPRWRRTGRALLPVMLGGVFVLQLFPAYKTYEKRDTAGWQSSTGERTRFPLFYYREDWQSHEHAVDWLAEHARRDQVVVTSTPHWLYLRTGMQAVLPPFTPNVEEAQHLVDAIPASFLIVDNLEFLDVTRRYAAPIVREFADRWRLVYASPDSASRVYQRTPEAGSTAVP